MKRIVYLLLLVVVVLAGCKSSKHLATIRVLREDGILNRLH